MTKRTKAAPPMPVEHGIREGVYDLAIGDVILYCLCGEACRGCNWEEAGSALDDHLEEVGDG